MAQLTARDRAILNCVFNPSLPLEEAYEEELDTTITDEEVDTSDVLQTKKLEIDAIKLAESGKLTEAITILNKAIRLTPHRPSLYNNRAQVYQFKGSIDDALNDLTTAINLCGDNYKKTKCQAHCQRGLLYRKFGEDDKAKDDFEVSAKIGSKFAKSQLVELNPYAALCNQMLRKVMEDLN